MTKEYSANSKRSDDLSTLPYKQLQALAGKYQVPGNCKVGC